MSHVLPLVAMKVARTILHTGSPFSFKCPSYGLLDFSAHITGGHFLHVCVDVCKCGYDYQAANSHKQGQKSRCSSGVQTPIAGYGTQPRPRGGVRCGPERAILPDTLIPTRESCLARTGRGTSETMLTGRTNWNLFFIPTPLLPQLSAGDPGTTCSCGRRDRVRPSVSGPDSGNKG